MLRMTQLAIVALTIGAQAPAAKAQTLAAGSTGMDWLAADVEQRVAWSQQMARLFNKEDAFGDAVDACLADMLADREDVDGDMLTEMRQGDLPMLTAGCVLSVQRYDEPAH